MSQQVSDCKNSDKYSIVIFAGSSAEKRSFQPTHAASGGTKFFGFCGAYFYK
jgi:hypothetical protein